MPPRRKPLRVAIADHLLSEHQAGRQPTLQQVAMEFRTNITLVSVARRELIRNGILPEPPRASRRKKTPEEKIAANAVRLQNSVSSVPSGDALIARMLGAGRAMTVDERRIFFSDLARSTDRDEIKVSALSALSRLEATLKIEQSLGPSAPRTRDEADVRISELQLARDDVFGS
jgi:hypothetical protein